MAKAGDDAPLANEALLDLLVGREVLVEDFDRYVSPERDMGRFEDARRRAVADEPHDLVATEPRPLELLASLKQRAHGLERTRGFGSRARRTGAERALSRSPYPSISAPLPALFPENTHAPAGISSVPAPAFSIAPPALVSVVVPFGDSPDAFAAFALNWQLPAAAVTLKVPVL